MGAFICPGVVAASPLAFSSKYGGNPAAASCSAIPRGGVLGLVSKMRNSGGFRLPQRVPPTDSNEFKRALQLLGSATQHRLTAPRRQELERLVGQLPRAPEVPNPRRTLQQYKGAMVNLRKEQRTQRPNRTGTALMHCLTLPPTNQKVSRAFVILERYRLCDVTSAPDLARQLRDLVGWEPTSVAEARLGIRALSRLVRRRKTEETRPPRLPDSDEVLHRGYMLLGLSAHGSMLGRQAKVLKEDFGGVPRDHRVARHWKARVRQEMRHRARVRVQAQRAIVIAQKRKDRLAKRQARALAEQTAAAPAAAAPANDDDRQ